MNNINYQQDYYIEQFWLDFKKSMINFYNIYKIISRPINIWSNKLNELQKKQKYLLIETHIRDYISLYAIDVLRFYDNYHMGILITNIKRWNTLVSKMNNFETSETKYINIVFLLIDIYNSFTNKCTLINDDIKYLFSTVEYYILHEDFTEFIDYAIKNNKPSVIDKINSNNYTTSILNCREYIEDKYNVKLSPKISGRKILDLIKT
jgi:hypothetical protein